MTTVGIICEYNPLHLGHQKQFHMIRQQFGEDCRIVCLMSGDYVQRGAPAITEKSIRAKAAVLSGADLVLEMPVTYSLSSAEGFASGGVRILSHFCDYLCFGTETLNRERLMSAAQLLLSTEFNEALKEALRLGCSFPAARQAAFEQLGYTVLSREYPNDILALEYCKAILTQNSKMEPLPIFREGNYHSDTPDPENPSATALRGCMESGRDWLVYVPEEARVCFSNIPIYALANGERAVLARLRTMREAEFEALPYGSEGLWKKLMHACHKKATLEEIITETKSKRYTRTRIDRMILCAFLGLDQAAFSLEIPYTRILAFNDRGREIMRQSKASCTLLNAGVPVDHIYWEIENRCSDLYGLFRSEGISPPGRAKLQRVCYCDHSERNG